MSRGRWLLGLMVTSLLGACTEADSRNASREPAAAATATVPGAPRVVVDSSFPPAEQLRRFRAASGDSVVAWTGGADSRDELIRRLVAAVKEADTAGLRSLTMSRAEFAWLYYDDSPLSRAPTRMDPALAWLIIEQNGAKGLTRLLRHYGGQPFDFRGYDCPEPAGPLGEGRVWEHCVIRHVVDRAEVSEVWFGGVLESGGTYKFVSLSNDF